MWFLLGVQDQLQKKNFARDCVCIFLPQFLVVDPVLCLGKAKLDEKNHEREKGRAMAVAKVQQLIEENALIVFRCVIPAFLFC